MSSPLRPAGAEPEHSPRNGARPLAVIDIGSNSARVVVYGASRAGACASWPAPAPRCAWCATWTRSTG